MPRDDWKRASDAARGRKELSVQAREREHPENYTLFVPEGATIFVKTANGYSRRLANASLRFRNTHAEDATHYWFSLSNGEIIAVSKRDVYQGPFVIDPGMHIFECNDGWRIQECDTRLFFQDVDHVDKLGFLHFQMPDSRSIIVPSTALH